MNTHSIEITSDFICPWCFVAETRLKRAIAQLKSTESFQLVWRPFELNPDMPELGIDRKTYCSQKFGSWAYSQQLDAHTIQATQDDHIEFRYDLMTVTPNTLKAHRLTNWAAQQNQATTMAERILRAYFTEGQNIADPEVLATLAADVGLDQNAAQALLQSNAGTQEIQTLEQRARTQGIQGVPSIRIGTERLSGAQSVATYQTALQTLLEAQS